jgi:hypothetical protein
MARTLPGGPIGYVGNLAACCFFTSQAQAGVATFEISAIVIRAELIASVEKSGV